MSDLDIQRAPSPAAWAPKGRDRVATRLLGLALLLAAAHLLFAALGWRSHTAALVGGHSAGNVLRAALYIASHLAAVLLAPICALAALLYLGLRRLLAPRRAPSQL